MNAVSDRVAARVRRDFHPPLVKACPVLDEGLIHPPGVLTRGEFLGAGRRVSGGPFLVVCLGFG
ncbi:hypothetical protein, partial [Lentzea sp. NPDC004782]|uniref:hypothetical protein n=1 Tax=Lentzea sp. NPDC004782 TaxID=3154458 RepID=UPI0033B713B5